MESVNSERDSSSKDLLRFGFLEILVKIAVLKFSAITESPAAAMEMLFDLIVKNYTCKPWQEFRDLSLWTLEVNDVFLSNLSGI